MSWEDQEMYGAPGPDDMFIRKSPLMTNRYNIQWHRSGVRWSREINGYIYEFQYLNNRNRRGWQNVLVVRRYNTKVKLINSQLNRKIGTTTRIFHDVTNTRIEEIMR